MTAMIKLNGEEFKALQKKNLEIAKYFVQFCKEHDLRVFVFAGTSLGAIRHKGFIPWDDDMDLCMPAPDYKKLLEIWGTEADTERYSLCTQTQDYNDHHLTDSIRDNNTTLIRESSMNTDTNQGVSLDLVPLHAAASSKIGRMFQLMCACGCSLFKAGRLPNRQSKVVYNFSKFLLWIFRGESIRFFIWNTLEKLATLPDRKYEKANYVKEFTMFPFITWLYPKKWFDKSVWVPFEDTEMPVAVGCREYLSKRYGNYMELPPVEERHPVIRIVFMDLCNSYKKYRGVQYLKNL